MIKKLAFTTLLLSTCLATASVNNYFNKALLVQELSENGEIKNQYFDYFAKDQIEEKFISVSPEFSSFGGFGICFNQDGSPCSRQVGSKAELTRAFSISSGRKQSEPWFRKFKILQLRRRQQC